jgi:hypothetical protein
MTRVEIAIDKLKKYKLSSTNQIVAELIQTEGKTCSEIHRLFILFGIRKELPLQWKESIILLIYKKKSRIMRLPCSLCVCHPFNF